MNGAPSGFRQMAAAVDLLLITIFTAAWIWILPKIDSAVAKILLLRLELFPRETLSNIDAFLIKRSKDELELVVVGSRQFCETVSKAVPGELERRACIIIPVAHVDIGAVLEKLLLANIRFVVVENTPLGWFSYQDDQGAPGELEQLYGNNGQNSNMLMQCAEAIGSDGAFGERVNKLLAVLKQHKYNLHKLEVYLKSLLSFGPELPAPIPNGEVPNWPAFENYYSKMLQEQPGLNRRLIWADNSRAAFSGYTDRFGGAQYGALAKSYRAEFLSGRASAFGQIVSTAELPGALERLRNAE